jgi:hypothetical protein
MTLPDLQLAVIRLIVTRSRLACLYRLGPVHRIGEYLLPVLPVHGQVLRRV